MNWNPRTCNIEFENINYVNHIPFFTHQRNLFYRINSQGPQSLKYHQIYMEKALARDTAG